MTPHLFHVFATFAPGGPQVRTVRMIDAFGDAYRHTVCAMDGRFEARELLTGSADVRFAEPPPKAGTLSTVRALRSLVRAVGADLVCTYNWGSIEAVLAAKTLGRKVLHHEDGFLPDEAAGFKRRRVVTRRFALPWARAVVVPSHTLHAIATETWKLPAEHVRLIPNGIDPDAFPSRDGNPARRAELGIPPDAFVVGGVGHLRGEKNPVRLVEAVGAMEAPAHLLLLGDGPERGHVEAARDRLGLGERVHLAGHRESPQADYRAMDAFCIPSDTEQMPVALLEAMASELPVASTDVGDVRVMLPKEQCEFVVKLDAVALARALDALASNPAKRRALGSANRARVVERYSFDGMLAAYRASYAAALE